jgi:hypothetical protein
MPPRRLNPRKLLVASVGVATINYLGTAATACSSSVEDGTPGDRTRTKDAGLDARAIGNVFPDGAHPPPVVANLVAPPPMPTVANLMAPPPHPSATVDASTRDAAPPHVRFDATVANLVAPPRFDATIANLMPPHTPKQ